MTLKWLTRVGIAATTWCCALAGCSDDPVPLVTGTAGSANGGGSAGHPAGGSSAGSGTAGSSTAGSATAGSATAGSAGTSGGGTAGSGGSSTAGSAGTAGSGGATAGSSNIGGEGGAGGASNEETLLFDFETDIQGWEGSDADVTLTSDAAQFVTGAKALKAVVPALAMSATRSIVVKSVKLWPGTKVVLHLWTPAGTDTLWAQAYTQSDNWKTWDTAGGSGVALVRGGWTTLTYTVPNTFPGGLQVLGVQIGAGDTAFAGGDFYIDSVVVSGGVEVCAGTGTATYGFETAAITPWDIDGNPAAPDTALVQSTTQAKTGTGALKVSFTALTAVGGDAARRIFAYAPPAYCGDEVTLNVWTPEGSDDLAFQAFAQFDNYSGWDAGAIPATITRGGWTEVKYTIPTTVGPGGLQRVGIQFLNNGVAYTGDVYIDDVSW